MIKEGCGEEDSAHHRQRDIGGVQVSVQARGQMAVFEKEELTFWEPRMREVTPDSSGGLGTKKARERHLAHAVSPDFR